MDNVTKMLKSCNYDIDEFEIWVRYQLRPRMNPEESKFLPTYRTLISFY